MGKRKWSEDTAASEALRYETRADFHDGSPSAYNLLSELNVLDKYCRHMTKRNIKWTYAAIAEEALKYKTRNQFKRNASGAYQKALKSGIISDVCKHMEVVNNQYTFEELQRIASNYQTKGMFKDKAYGAYQSACRRGIINDITSHMYSVPAGFKPMLPAILYYFKIEFNGKYLWKIGITNYTLEDRYYTRDLEKITDIKIWSFELGLQAYDYERTLLKLYSNYKYTGETPFTDGTKGTECFTIDILEKEVDTNGDAIE